MSKLGDFFSELFKAILNLVPKTYPPSPGNTLWANERLLRGEYRISKNGFYKLEFQYDGNLVLHGYGAHTSISSTEKPDGYESYCDMQADGNLVVYKHRPFNYQGGGEPEIKPQPQWASGTEGNPGAYLIVDNNGYIAIVGWIWHRQINLYT